VWEKCNVSNGEVGMFSFVDLCRVDHTSLVILRMISTTEETSFSGIGLSSVYMHI
jgi:hypothetical protein